MKSFLFFVLAFAILFTSETKSNDVPDMLDRVFNGVVTVAVYKTAPLMEATLYGYRGYGFRGGSRGSRRSRGTTEMAYEQRLNLKGALASGSGFVIDWKGNYYIITNSHVVQSADTSKGSIFVYSVNNSKYEVKVLGGDTFYDIAILRFIDNPGREIRPLEFRKNDIKIGESVYAIGNPIGDFPYTVTDGIVSGKNRRGQEKIFGLFGFIQSTATITWGNSGGPLVDSKGRVVGVNSQLVAASSVIQSQINLALDKSICQKIVNDVLENNGLVRRIYLGAEFTESYSRDWRYGNTYIDTIPILNGFIPNSPASEYLQKYIGCEVLELNSKKVYNLQDLLEILEFAELNKPLRFKFKRGNDIFDNVEVNPDVLSINNLSALAPYFFKKFENADIEMTGNGLEVKVTTVSGPVKGNIYNDEYYEEYDDEYYEEYDDEYYEEYDDEYYEPARNKFTRKKTRGVQSIITRGSRYQQDQNNLSLKTERFTIYSAGVYPNLIWKVNNLADLSAIIRFLAMTGYCDFVLSPIGYPHKTFTLSKKLSNSYLYDTNILWY